MAHMDMHRFWQDHAGLRWLVPTMALLAVVILALAYMLIYPYVS